MSLYALFAVGAGAAAGASAHVIGSVAMTFAGIFTINLIKSGGASP